MTPVFVLAKNGKKLIPTMLFWHVRHLLKDDKAKIVEHFTIQLQYENSEFVQHLELGVDISYNHVGISLNSYQREHMSDEFDLLKDEKERHDAARSYRYTIFVMEK